MGGIESELKKIAPLIPRPAQPPEGDADPTPILLALSADFDENGEMDYALFTDGRRDSYPYIFLRKNGQLKSVEELLSAGQLGRSDIEKVEMNKFLVLQNLPPNALPEPKNKK